MVYDFIYKKDSDGLRKVRMLDLNYNLIDKDENLILKENCFSLSELDSDGLRIIRLNYNQENLLDSNGNLILKENYIDISNCNENGIRILTKETKEKITYKFT